MQPPASNGTNLPIYPPPELLIQITNNDDLAGFVNSFAIYRTLISEAMAKVGKSLAESRDILDFGCGAGRLYYALNEHANDSQVIYGCDLNEKAVAWCRGLGYEKVVKNTTKGHLDFPPSSFDLVVAVSVFTHLDIELQHHWASELRRIIRPGGCLFVTVHGSTWFPQLVKDYTTHPNASNLELLHLGDDALFLDLRYSGGVDLDPQGQREVATAHTDQAVKKIFQGFDVGAHESQSCLARHDTYLLVRQ